MMDVLEIKIDALHSYVKESFEIFGKRLTELTEHFDERITLLFGRLEQLVNRMNTLDGSFNRMMTIYDDLWTKYSKMVDAEDEHLDKLIDISSKLELKAFYDEAIVACSSCGKYEEIYESILCHACKKFTCKMECYEDHICAVKVKVSQKHV